MKAAECAGLMLACVITWQTHAGKACFQRRAAGVDKHNKITDFIHQFEQLVLLAKLG